MGEWDGSIDVGSMAGANDGSDVSSSSSSSGVVVVEVDVVVVVVVC
jgi:hypothetical protein